MSKSTLNIEHKIRKNCYNYTSKHRGKYMLHEYKEEIHELKMNNAHFAKVFEKHNELDKQIEHAENGDTPLTDMELEVLKKEKLQLKDEAYKMILDYKKSK
jgi:hypothetical protein